MFMLYLIDIINFIICINVILTIMNIYNMNIEINKICNNLILIIYLKIIFKIIIFFIINN